MYLDPSFAYYTAEALVLGTVKEVLPYRLNPLASAKELATSSTDRPGQPQPVIYKGYVLDVEKAYGPDTVPSRVTVYALGDGRVVLDGATYEVRASYPLNASPGNRLFAPLVKVAYFGTRPLENNECWVPANWAVFCVDESGCCRRVAGSDLDPEMKSLFKEELRLFESLHCLGVTPARLDWSRISSCWERASPEGYQWPSGAPRKK